MSEEITKHHLARIRDANSAISGLMRLKFTLLDESDTGEMPEWWGEFYDEAIQNAIWFCAEAVDSSAVWLEDNALGDGAGHDDE